MVQTTSKHVFISYSRKDNDVMRRIVLHLREQGIKAWVDNEFLTPGTRVWEYEIERAIVDAFAVVVVLSPDAKNSEWVLREITLADEYQKQVFPIIVSGRNLESVPFRLVTRQFADMRQSEPQGLQSLSEAVSSYWNLFVRIEEERKAAEQEALRLETERKAREEAERIAQQKAETEKKAKEEASRIAQEKAEEERIAKARLDAERKAKAKADRIARQKEAAEKLARLEAEKKAQEEANQLAQQTAEQERLTRAKLEAERKAKEEADRIAQEKAEQEKLFTARFESERLAAQKAEQERLAKAKAEQERIVKAKADDDRAAKAEADRLAAQKAEEARRAQANSPISSGVSTAQVRKSASRGVMIGVFSVAILVLVVSAFAINNLMRPAATATEEHVTEAPATTETPPTAEIAGIGETSTPTITTFNEAPDITALVQAGQLPSVRERLPDQPVVTSVVDSIGKYGGTLHTASWWPEVGNVQLYFAVEAPIKWKADLTGYEPGLVESYEWSEDGKTFTMHMREGLKWSDGEPYTTADWRYWWEDFAKNPDQNIWTIPSYLRNADGTPIDMAFPDDYTIVWESKDRSLWIDPYFMAQGFWEFAKYFMKPAHYLKQFHPAYSAGRTWDDYALEDRWWQNPGYPCLFAWCMAQLSSDGLNYTFRRNPYYWRVDVEGNQLPYIDAITVEIVPDEQTRILNCAQGKYDTGFRICGGPAEIPFLIENATAGGYHFLENYMNGAGAWPGYMVNQDYVEGGRNYENDTPEYAAEIRTLLRDVRFRRALSIGFDRQRVIDVAWGGIGEAKNYTLSPQSWHFAGVDGQAEYQKWASNYSNFDTSAANALLNEIGMAVGADGFRQLPSGRPFELWIDISDWGGSLKVQVDAAEEMKRQWENNLGIKVKINNLQGQPELDIRTIEGYYMLRSVQVTELDVLTYPNWLFPVVNGYYFPLQGRWFARGGDACNYQPTEGSAYPCGLTPEVDSPAQKLQALYNQARGTTTVEGRQDVMWQAIDIHIDEGPFVIGVSGDQPMPVIIKDHMRNILGYGVVSTWVATPGNQIASQWWIDE